MRVAIDTWDFFDTLASRFVMYPQHVFTLVERRSGVEDFARRRVLAQQRLDQRGQPYTLHQIYQCMQEHLGLAPEQARRLIGMELVIEMDQMIPIQRQVERVAPQDLVVSDMYLAADQVHDMMRRICGMNANRPPVVGNWGKASGSLWSHLGARYLVRSHHGDNPQSDIANARQAGIPAERVEDARLTPWEERVANTAMPHLALLTREVRLRCMPQAADAFHATVLGPYMSFLLCAALYLRQLAVGGRERKLVFVSRDGCHVSHLFRTICPEVDSELLDLTRALLRSGQADAVFANRLPPDCLIVDMVSSGQSLSRFFARNGIDRECLLFMYFDRLLDDAQRQNHQQRMLEGKLATVFRASDFNRHHLGFEVLLDPGHPTVIGVHSDDGSGALVKHFGPDEYSAAEHVRVEFVNRCVSKLGTALARRGFPAEVPAPQLLEIMRAALEAIGTGIDPVTTFPTVIAREGGG